MKSKLILLTVTLLTGLCGVRTFAQSIIVQGGFSLSEIKQKQEGGLVLDADMRPGFHGGVFAELPINNVISFVPGLLYSNKGATVKQNILGSEIKGGVSLHYLDIPLTVKATGNIKDNAKVFAVLGPYVGIGMSGRIKAKTTNAQGTTESRSGKVSWGNGEDDYSKRLEAGATVGAGVEFSSFLISVNYDYGLTDISADDRDSASLKNRVLRLTLGYHLGK